MTTPITPDEAKSAKDELNCTMPVIVITTVNQLIVDNYSTSGSYCRFTSKELAEKLKAACKKARVKYNEKWLDIEPLYRKFGWNVNYDKPAYNETYDGFYTFKRKQE